MNVYENFKSLKNPENYKFENVKCYQCGSDDSTYLLTGEEDLTAKEGQFQYVTCNNCGLAYQNPRVHVDQIKNFYDSEYIAHRKKKNWEDPSLTEVPECDQPKAPGAAKGSIGVSV